MKILIYKTKKTKGNRQGMVKVSILLDRILDSHMEMKTIKLTATRENLNIVQMLSLTLKSELNHMKLLFLH